VVALKYKLLWLQVFSRPQHSKGCFFCLSLNGKAKEVVAAKTKTKTKQKTEKITKKNQRWMVGWMDGWRRCVV